MQQSFYLQVISAKCEDWPKALIVNIMAWRPKKKRNKDTLFAAIPNVWEKSGLTFLQKPYPTGDGCNYPRLPEKQNIQYLQNKISGLRPVCKLNVPIAYQRKLSYLISRP